MKKEREQLLRTLIGKLTHSIHEMSVGHDFPLGNCLLRKQQAAILFFVYENKGLASVKEIAKFLQVTPGAVTQFVDGLVKKKLVKREENPMDRRSINIKLADQIKEQLNDFRKKYIRAASRIFDNLSDQELKIFIELLGKIKSPQKNI